MGLQRIFDQLSLIQMIQPNQPIHQLRAKERSLLVQLIQSLLLEIAFNRTTETTGEESDNE
jgi:hypothetical protein